MSLSNNERITIRSYNKNAREWAQQHATPGYWKEQLEKFKIHLPNGKVLEIGVGGGRDANDLIAAGYDYVGTDLSIGFLRETKQNLHNPQLVNCDLNHMPFKDNTFDGFWASAVLLHIPRADTGLALWSIWKAIRNGGMGFISLKEGVGEQVETEVLPSGSEIVRAFTYWQDESFKQILHDQNFDILYAARKETGRTIWLTYIVKVVKDSSVAQF